MGNRADTEKINGIFSEFKKAVTLKYKEDIMTIVERLEQRGKEADIKIGRKEGKTQGIKNIALNMLSKDIDAEFTGMTVKDIDKLKNN